MAAFFHTPLSAPAATVEPSKVAASHFWLSARWAHSRFPLLAPRFYSISAASGIETFNLDSFATRAGHNQAYDFVALLDAFNGWALAATMPGTFCLTDMVWSRIGQGMERASFLDGAAMQK